MSIVGRSKETESKLAEGFGENGETANGYRVSFGGDEN